MTDSRVAPGMDYRNLSVHRRINVHALMLGGACGVIAGLVALFLFPPRAISPAALATWSAKAVAAAWIGFAVVGTARWWRYRWMPMTDDRQFALVAKTHAWHGEYSPAASRPPSPGTRPPSGAAPASAGSPHPAAAAAPQAARSSRSMDADPADAIASRLAVEAVVGLLARDGAASDEGIAAWLERAAGGHPDVLARARHFADRLMHGPLPLD
jgi:hypothetical protein